MEKFVGKNLIALAGIVILVLGVGIGAKFAIDNGWISPLARVVFGYVVGFGLIGTAVKLKARYLNFSAVLLSGGMAIMYFVTYFGYANYGLIAQSSAFSLMAIFTAFTVISAILYDRQVVAHIGLVGAYAVPFLLSDDSGSYLFLFVYMAIINFGIMVVGVTKRWRAVFFTSIIVTWLIYLAWFVVRYSPEQHFGLAAASASVFFAIFYVAEICDGLLHEAGTNSGTLLLLTNSFVFYGFGVVIMESRSDLRKYEGMLTIGHAIMHSAVSQAVSRLRPSVVHLVQLLTILVITFVTITVPVQFDGRVVTLVWTVEAAALFWFGRARAIRLFELYSYPLIALATGSLLYDWVLLYSQRTLEVTELNRTPLANGDFVTGLVYVAGIAFICLINRNADHESAVPKHWVQPIGMFVAALGLFALYNTFRIEISNYYHLQTIGHLFLYNPDAISQGWANRNDLSYFNLIWQLNYTMFFLFGLGVVNLKKVGSTALALVNMALVILALGLFATCDMYFFAELRASYMAYVGPEYVTGPMNVAVRYITYLFAGGSLAVIYWNLNSKMVSDKIPATVREIGWDALCYITILIAASFELINLLVQFHIPDGNKLGISIFWGVYALMLIGIGLAWNKKHLRVSAIALLGITIVKLFLYDVADLPTIPKTILFVSLGITLLVVSFVYNKFTVLIVNKEPDSD